MHGFTATTSEVRMLAKALFERGYTVAGPLLPGHGTTPQDCNQYSWEEWAQSIEGMYQRMAPQCKMVIVGGESAGALLALHMAYTHPEVAAILCYAPALRLKLGRTKLLLLSLLAPFRTSIPKPPPADNNPWQGYSVQPLKGARQLIRLQKAVAPLFPEIHQPILIMQGRLDPTVHPAVPKMIFDKIGSTVKVLHWLEYSTHCVILDKERELAASLTLDFLNRLPELA